MSGGPVAAATITPGGLTPKQVRLVFVGLLMALFLSALDGTIVSTALPRIAGDLGGLSNLPWIFTAYLLAQTAATPLFGKISDLYGRKVLLQAAVVLFLVGSVACGASQNVMQLIFARGFQGIGAGGIMSMSFIIVGDIVSPRERGRYIGVFTGVFALSSVVGPLVGGAMVDHLGWRWVFYINIPLGVAALVVTSVVLRLSWARSSHRIDFEGAAVLVAGVVCLMLATTWGGQEYSWGSPVILSLAGAAVVLTAVFVWWESKAAEPIVPLRLFRNRTFVISVIISFFLGSAMFGATSYLPMWYQAVRGTSATASGLRMIPIMAGVTIASVTVGRFVTRSGKYRVYPMIGSALAVVGFALLSLITATSSMWFLALAMLVVGLGVGSTMPVMSIAAQNCVEQRDLGIATAGVTFFRSLGGAIGVATYGSVLFGRLITEMRSLLPPGSDTSREALEGLVRSPEAIKALPADVATAVKESLANALGTTFVVVVPCLVVGLVAATRLRDVALRETANVGAMEASEPAIA